jgi:hypothetical protein
MASKPKTISTNRVRGGIGTHVVRTMLIVSTLLAVGAMLWVYLAAPKATDPAMETPASSAAIPPPPAPR